MEADLFYGEDALSKISGYVSTLPQTQHFVVPSIMSAYISVPKLDRLDKKTENASKKLDSQTQLPGKTAMLRFNRDVCRFLFLEFDYCK